MASSLDSTGSAAGVRFVVGAAIAACSRASAAFT